MAGHGLPIEEPALSLGASSRDGLEGRDSCCGLCCHQCKVRGGNRGCRLGHSSASTSLDRLRGKRWLATHGEPVCMDVCMYGVCTEYVHTVPERGLSPNCQQSSSH